MSNPMTFITTIIITVFLVAGVIFTPALAQVVMPSRPVPALGYKIDPGFFKLPSDWSKSEVSGVDINSKGHIFLFRRVKPMLTEFDQLGNLVRIFDDHLFDQPHGLRIDRDDNLWTIDDGNHMLLKLSPTGKILMVSGRGLHWWRG